MNLKKRRSMVLNQKSNPKLMDFPASFFFSLSLLLELHYKSVVINQ